MDDLRQALLAAERSGVPYEELNSLWTKAKDAIENEDDAVALYTTFIYMTRRYIAKQGSTDFSLVEALFEEALAFVDECFEEFGEEAIQLHKNYAYFLYAKSKKPEKARLVWHKLLADENEAWTWLEAISMERSFGCLEHTRRLFFKAVDKVTVRAPDMFKAFVQFEREEGTLEELEFALGKINAKAARLAERRKANFNGTNAKKKQQQRAHENSPIEGQKNGNKLLEDKASKLQKQKAIEVSKPQKQKTIEDKKPTQPTETMEKQSESRFQFSTGLEKDKLFIRNVHFDCSEDELKEFFQKYGSVKSVRIVRYKSGKPKGVAYVEFESEEAASNGLKAHGEKLHKKKISVALSNPPAKNDQSKVISASEMPEKKKPRLQLDEDGPTKEMPEKKLQLDEDGPTKRVAKSSRLMMVPRSINKMTQ